jgi:uncharacterized cupin superfamily protein
VFTPIRWIKLVAALAAIVAVTGGMAATAHASAYIDSDDVSLGSGSFKFTSGDLVWLYGDEEYSAELKGDLTINNASGSCARMRMEYFENGASLNVKYGGTVCAPDGKSNTWSVDLNPWSDPRIDLLKVSLQKETAADGWSTVESDYFEPNIPTDKVRLSADGVDFGDDWFALGATTGSGTLSWQQGDGALITPRLQGYLHLNNMAGVCARMKLVYRNASWQPIATKYGGEVCAPDNDHHYWSVDLAPWSSTDIDSVRVSMQTQGTNGSWNDVTGSNSNWIYEIAVY